MPRQRDPIGALKDAAGEFPDVVEGASCNQTTYKVGGKAFLYVGPGAKGIGFKAMFKLGPSLGEARILASDDPNRFQVGAGDWVTARFTADDPLPKKTWSRWLRESYTLASGGGRTP